jgi:hypothetical protein
MRSGDCGDCPILSFSANPLLWECGIKERCYLALVVWQSAVLLELDALCYLSVLLHLGYKKPSQHV